MVVLGGFLKVLVGVGGGGKINVPLWSKGGYLGSSSTPGRSVDDILDPAIWCPFDQPGISTTHSEMAA